MYKKTDYNRVINVTEADYRSAFRRDFARLLHSPSFRRLQGKTQLYPGIESDFFRNRLTHSLEVAQIAKSIALKLNHEVLEKESLTIDVDVCEFAGLAHDLGHPPFGHQGEEALDECMRNYGGFEGNAQTLRILAKLEKKKVFESSSDRLGEDRVGLNLAFRSLASILKYDNEIPISVAERSEKFKEKPIKGYYASEKSLVSEIKKNVVSDNSYKGFKTIECQIMDIADDIAYSTYDLEDGLKAGFYHPVSMLSYPIEVYERIASKVSDSMGEKLSSQDILDTLHSILQNVYEINIDEGVWESVTVEGNEDDYLAIPRDSLRGVFVNYVNFANTVSQRTAKEGELRGDLTSKLVNRAIEGVLVKINKTHPSQSKVYLNAETKLGVEVLKNFTYESQIQSPRLKVAEYRGKQIVTDIFKALIEKSGWMLLPEDHQTVFKLCSNDLQKYRCICDFIAGMTDKYAIEFYGRLKSEKPESFFRPF